MSAAVPRTFRPGDYLFKEGESSDSMFLIQKGTVSIRKMKGSGHIEIGRVYTNEVLGELSFFDRLPRSASAFALSEVEVLEITFDSLDKIYKQIPPYFQTIMACVADRLRKSGDRLRRLQKNVVDDEVPQTIEALDDIEDAGEEVSSEENTASVLAGITEHEESDDSKE